MSVARAVRSDAGRVRLTERDLHALGWLAQMRTAYEDDLGVLLGRWSGERASVSATRQTVNRWVRAGVASAAKVLAARPRIVSLTVGGAQLVGEGAWREGSPWTAAHGCEVAKARLWLEAVELPWGQMQEWTPQRELDQAAMPQLVAGARLHKPDGLALLADGTVAAVEVELSAKGSRRLREVVEQVTADYAVTIYLSHDQRILRSVLAAYEQVRAGSPVLPPGVLVAWEFPEVLS